MGRLARWGSFSLACALGAASGVAGVAAMAVAAAILLSLLNTVRPPEPMRFGKVAMAYECGFSVDAVRRTPALGQRRSAGEYYVVDGRVVCPFGERQAWSLDSVFVASNGVGARTAPDRAATAAIDPGSVAPHTVLGAEERVHVVFDLPRDTVQPALVYAPAVAPGALLDAWSQLRIYHPRRFNLRRDPGPVPLANR